MKRVTWTISACESCPFSTVANNGTTAYWICKHSKPYKVSDVESFYLPKWCPLPECEDE